MFPFDRVTSFSDTEITIATRALLRVLHVDGPSPSALARVRAFYESGVETEGLPLFDDLDASCRTDIHLDAARFSEAAVREQILALCWLAAWSDGACSAGERAVITALAEDLDVAPDRSAALETLVKDSLLSGLAHLPDAPSLAAVARELG